MSNSNQIDNQKVLSTIAGFSQARGDQKVSIPPSTALHTFKLMALSPLLLHSLVATIYIMYYMVATTGHLHQLPRMK